MSTEEKSIIFNKIAIKIDQDPTEQGRIIKKKQNYEIWVKHLKNNEEAILLLNLNRRKAINISYQFKNKNSKYIIIDVFSEKKLPELSRNLSFKVLPDSSIFLLAKPIVQNT